jgi:hypothetical protein
MEPSREPFSLSREALEPTPAPWTLTHPLVQRGFSNPQGHLALTNTQGIVLLAGDVYLLNPDQLAMLSAVDSITTIPMVAELLLTKMTP